MKITIVICLISVICSFNIFKKCSSRYSNVENIKKDSLQVVTQPTDTEWLKDPSTNIYSYEEDIKQRNQLIDQEVSKMIKNWDSEKVYSGLLNSDPNIRINSIRILGFIPNNAKIKEIERLLTNDVSPEVRTMCAKSLAQLKNKSSVPILIKTLSDNDNEVRIESALALASLDEKERSLQYFQTVFKNDDRRAKLKIDMGLRDIANEPAIALLQSAMNDKDPYVSVDAAIVLSQLKYYKEAFPVLKQKLKESDKYLRLAALRGLAYIGNDKSIDLIKNSKNDPDPLVQDRCNLILKNIGK